MSAWDDIVEETGASGQSRLSTCEGVTIGFGLAFVHSVNKGAS